MVPDAMGQMLAEFILLRLKDSWMIHIVLNVAMDFGIMGQRVRLTVRHVLSVESESAGTYGTG